MLHPGEGLAEASIDTFQMSSVMLIIVRSTDSSIPLPNTKVLHINQSPSNGSFKIQTLHTWKMPMQRSSLYAKCFVKYSPSTYWFCKCCLCLHKGSFCIRYSNNLVLIFPHFAAIATLRAGGTSSLYNPQKRSTFPRKSIPRS